MRTLHLSYRVAFAAMMLALPVAIADIDLPSVPPPQPQPVAAKVYIGESVEIPLSGVSRAGGGLQFLIRRQPVLGSLSAIRMTGPNTGVVTYTHSPQAGTGVDHFRYAAGAAGIGVSTPAEVTISVTERPAVFVAPVRADFPDTSVGQSSRQTIEIRNDGGGFIDGRLIVPEPWSVADGDGSYVIGPGGISVLTIQFSPKEARAYTGIAEFSHAPGLELGLGGGGYNPVEVVPREIRLETDGRNEVRTGGFLVRNISLDGRELRVTAPPEVVVQETLHSPAQSETQVAVHTRAGFLGGLESKITISGEGILLEVPLRVMPAPARLAATPGKLDFGTLDAGRSGRAKITLRNSGGSATRLTTRVPAGVSINPDPAGKPLEAGESREFEIRLARPLAGAFSGDVVFGASDSEIKIPVVATIRTAWEPGDKSRPAAPATKEVEYSDIPPVAQLGVTRQTKTELDLAWKREPADVARYDLFMRTIVFDGNGKAQTKYVRLDRVKVRFVRKEARVTLAGLRPGESVTLHIVGYDEAGRPSRPSEAFTVATQPKPIVRIPWLWIGVAVLCVLAVLIVRDRRRRRAALAAEIEQIGRP